MGALQLLVVAVVQGFTEYLPISSTAHLILVPRLFGWPDQGLAIDVAANTGTLGAVLLYFRRDLLGFARALGRPALTSGETAERRRMIPLLLLASAPVLVAGIAAYDWIAGAARSPGVIAAATLGFGVLLGVADRWGGSARGLHEIRAWQALVFGAAQAMALVPGASRAGVTMTAGRLLGFDRESSARFAFLMAIPAGFLVAGKDALDLLTGAMPVEQLPAMLFVALVSGVVGYAVIGLFLGWVRRHSLQVFVVYRVVLGLVLIALF